MITTQRKKTCPIISLFVTFSLKSTRLWPHKYALICWNCCLEMLCDCAASFATKIKLDADTGLFITGLVWTEQLRLPCLRLDRGMFTAFCDHFLESYCVVILWRLNEILRYSYLSLSALFCNFENKTKEVLLHVSVTIS